MSNAMPSILGDDPTYASWLTYGFICSALLHLFLFLLAQKQLLPPDNSKEVIEVSFIPTAPFASKPRIASESKAKKVDTAPKNARFQGAENRETVKEQIKRGDGEDAGRVVGRQAPPPGGSPNSQTQSKANTQSQNAQPNTQAQNNTQAQPRKSSPQQATSKRPLKSLKLSATDLQGEFGVSNPLKKDAGPPARALLSAPTGLPGYRPFSRPAGSGARFLGNTGNTDYLPQLPDGDITLLNAKANKFAVFVRRVATRVFSKLRASGWENLSAADIRSMKGFSTIRAVLSPEGKLLDVRLEGPSGSKRFDGVLSQAVNNGATDPHPPPGALASDGNIHFIFKARSWSQVGPSRGGRGYAEQRWLLLATGLG